MTKYADDFFTNPVSVKRRDGHSANDLLPIGEHLYVDLSDGTEKIITPPPDAVAFYGNFIVGNGVRYTLDGVTSPTNNIGFNSIPGGAPVFIKPGTAIRVKVQSVSVAALNLQWLGTV